VHNEHAALQLSAVDTNATHNGCSLMWTFTCYAVM
jgi:hypothetical protein